MTSNSVGLSGLSIHVPRYRVDLQQWCDWTGNDWRKISAVVGHGFRMRGPQQSMYTLAAEAVLDLILRHDIDPARVGFLALGTESSTDNAAGTVIVRGMLDDALRALGKPPLARDCEVPEYKHACLGGAYALKGALRYLACDGAQRQAIVVAADIAEYARGSTGEPTQGAGAVAMLLEANPRIMRFDLAASGSSSDYRALDFRKPFARFCGQPPGPATHIRDFPVFNGKYSTACYIEATLQALDAMFARRGVSARAEMFRELPAVFLHRPYHRMPHNAWALGYLFALAADGGAAHDELSAYCSSAGVELASLLDEIAQPPTVAEPARRGDISADPYPQAMQVLKAFRASERYQEVVENKMRLGGERMMELGNLYTAALFAWLAAGLTQAAEEGLDLDGREILLMGYGSGDAAEAIPARLVPGWQEVAARSGFAAALADAADLSRAQYESLHDRGEAADLPEDARSRFLIDAIGERDSGPAQDYGIAYYRYRAGA